MYPTTEFGIGSAAKLSLFTAPAKGEWRFDRVLPAVVIPGSAFLAPFSCNGAGKCDGFEAVLCREAE